MASSGAEKILNFIHYIYIYILIMVIETSSEFYIFFCQLSIFFKVIIYIYNINIIHMCVCNIYVCIMTTI